MQLRSRIVEFRRTGPLHVECVKISGGSMHSYWWMTGSTATSGDRPTDCGMAEAGDARLEVGSHDFGAVYQEHFDFMWRTLRRYGVPEAAIDDAIQDAFLVVHKRLPTFEGRSSFRTWIFGIARRVARDHRPAARARAANADILDALPDVESKSPLATLEMIEGARLLEKLLASLDPDKREAFILVKLEQMTILEAGQALGVNTNTIYSRVRTARRELEQALFKTMNKAGIDHEP